MIIAQRFNAGLFSVVPPGLAWGYLLRLDGSALFLIRAFQMASSV